MSIKLHLPLIISYKNSHLHSDIDGNAPPVNTMKSGAANLFMRRPPEIFFKDLYKMVGCTRLMFSQTSSLSTVVLNSTDCYENVWLPDFFALLKLPYERL